VKKLILVLSLFAGTALAQTPSPTQTPSSPARGAQAGEVPVAGSRASEGGRGTDVETIYSDAQLQQDQSLSRRTVESLLAPPDGFESQYSRWKRPVCFNVYGLSAAVKFVMERRMKEIAAQVGAPVDRNESCEPTVTIAFTTDPPATLESVAKVRPWLVPGLGMIRSRVREEQPIQAWYATGVRGSNGRLSLLYDGYDDEPQRIGTSVFNHLDSGIETEIASVLVVVNTNAIMGMQLGPLADHFALVSLAEANFTRKCKPVRTVANHLQACYDKLDVHRRPESLPPRFQIPGSNRLTWQIKVIKEWMDTLAEAQAVQRTTRQTSRESARTMSTPRIPINRQR